MAELTSALRPTAAERLLQPCWLAGPRCTRVTGRRRLPLDVEHCHRGVGRRRGPMYIIGNVRKIYLGKLHFPVSDLPSTTTINIDKLC